jgi:ABC-2 type transport system permease protein
MKTIYILWLRQIKRYLRSKSRIVGSLAQPLLFLIALGYGLSPVFQKAGQGNYTDFLVPGIIGMSIIFTSVFSGIEVIWDRQFGFLKETLVAPVSRIHIATGRILGGATTALLQGLVVMIIALVFGFLHMNLLMIPFALITMLLIAILFTAIGTAIASKLEDMQGFQLIMNFLVMPVFFLSGALFPLEGLPKGLNIVAQFDPLSYGVDALRSFLTGVHHFSLFTDFSVLIILSAIFIGLASYFFTKIEA